MSFWSWLTGLFHHEDAPVVQLPRPEPKPEPKPPAEKPPVIITARTSKTAEERIAEYASDYAGAFILDKWADQAKRQALLAQQNHDRYQAIAAKASEAVRLSSPMPWYVPATIAMMESHIADWGAYLGNGEHIIGTGRKSSLVPQGRGPFATWEEGALDALTSERLRNVIKWDIPHLLAFSEGYNGWGYWKMGKRSPYIWSGTNLGVGVGKYVADGVYRSDAVSDQLGIGAVLKAMGVA